MNISIREEMKYLDSRLSFESHFALLAPGVEEVEALLECLLPNIGGPRNKVRTLYMGVIRSMVLYGSPIWSGNLDGKKGGRVVLRRIQRSMAIRMVRA